MATAASRTGKTGRVVAGSMETMRVPARTAKTQKTDRRTSRRQRTGTAPVTGRHRRQPVYGPKQLATTTKAVTRKATAIGRAFVISLTLTIPAVFQMIIAVMLAVAIGFLDIGFIAWATQNFEIVDVSAEYFFGSMLALGFILNLLMFAYIIMAYVLTGVSIFTPGALIALAICFTLTLFPPISIIPWALVYVWVVALSR